MRLIRSGYILILLWLITASILAQDNTERFLAYDDIVGDVFASNVEVGHDWQLQADAGNIVELQLRRIGGVFIPRLELIAPDGSIVLATTDESDDYGQTLIFQDGLPENGTYIIRVSQQNASSDGVLTQSEYSLSVMYRGQVLPDDIFSISVPETISQALPDYFIGDADSSSFPGIDIFGDVSVTEVDTVTSLNRFLLQGTSNILINDTNVVSRVLSRIAFLDDGLALQSNSGAVLFSNANISNLSLEGQVLSIEFDNNRIIRTDFYAIEAITVLEEQTAIRLIDGQILIFDDLEISLTRRGGIRGEGPNAEPILMIRVGADEIQTDLSGWHTFSLENDLLTLIYPGGWQIQSDELSASFLQGGNSFRPDLNALDVNTDLFDVRFNLTEDESLGFTIDPQGLRGIQIEEADVSLDFLDNRQIVDSLTDLSSVEISNQVARLKRKNRTVSTILSDGTRIFTPSEIPMSAVALPFEGGFRPQNFNNTGRSISDYHPRVDMDFALLPVNQVIGNFVYPVQDYALPGASLSLEWSRTYNSMVSDIQTPDYLRDNNAMYADTGHYWRHQYQIELDVQFAPAGEVRLILADGSSHIFNASIANADLYRSNSLLSWTIEQIGDFSGDWMAYRGDGIQYQFDAGGRLERITDIQGHFLLFSPIPQSYLSAFDADGGFFVTETYGRRLEVYTDDSGHVITVREVQGRTFHYQYQDDLLVEVDYPGAGYGANYSYDEGRLSLIDDVNSPYARKMSLNYNSEGRVRQYSYYPDDELSESYDLRYEDERTVISWRVMGNDKRNDNREIVLEYDANYRITSRTMPDDDWVYQWRYSNETGLLAEIVQPTLAVLRVSYNRNGYLTRFTDPLFGSATGFYGFTYEPGEKFTTRLIQIDAPDVNSWQTLRYDSQNRLLSRNQLISGIGNNREFQQTGYRYREGELYQIIEPGEEVITEFEYDAFGYPNQISRLSASDASSVQEWQLVHDGVGRLLQIVDSQNNISRLQWNNDRNLLLNLNLMGEVYDYEYDEVDNLIAYRVPGIRETYAYDDISRLIERNDGRETSTYYQYDSVGNLIRLTMPDGGYINYRYDVLDNLVASSADDEFETLYSRAFNQESNRTIYTISNPLDEQTQYQFDPLGRLRLVSDFDRDVNLTSRYALTYNARGNLTEVADGRGRILTLSYDFADKPLTSAINNNARTSYQYNERGLLESLTNPARQSINYHYDFSANPIQVSLEDGSEQFYRYDSVGNLLSFINAIGAETLYSYDGSNRLITETNPLNAIRRYSYDNEGNLSAIIDPRPDIPATQFAYDDLNRLIAVTNPLEGITRYEYDANNNLVKVVEPGGLQTTFTYDPADNIVAVTQPGDREFLYGRDSIGRIISETNPSGQTNNFSYNVIGKIGRIIGSQGQGQSFGWYGNGRLTRYSVSNGAEYEYIADSVGRLVEIVDLGIEESKAVNTRIEYDAMGRITTIRQGNRLLIEGDNAISHVYIYDEAGRVIRYRPPESTAFYSFEYDLAGNLIREINLDGIETDYAYDLAGNLIEIVYLENTDAPIRENYRYDLAGNLIYARADGLERYYFYDGINQLTQLREVSADGEREHFFAYDVDGRIISYIDPRGFETSYRYDLFGNPVAIEERRSIDSEDVSRITRYGYDSLDNLVVVQAPDGQSINMIYNGIGQRVRYVDAMNNSWSFSYDSEGNISQISNPLGNNEAYQFDISNRLSQISYATGATINFTYDGLGNLDRVILPETANSSLREQVNYDFDTKENLIGIMHTVDNVTTIERDDSGRVVTIRTPGDAEIELTYDASGYIASIDANGETISRTYDSAGQLMEIAEGDDIYRLSYDAYGNISAFDLIALSPGEDSEMLETVELSTHYVHDIVGNIIERNAGEYGTIRYVYDVFDRPIRIEMNEHWLEIEYNANAWRTALRRSNGVETRYNYDANGRVRNIAHININADNQRLDAFAYDYDGAGNIIRVTRSDNRAILYSYDATQQLLSERWLSESNQIEYSVNYTYDDAGNRIEQTRRLGGENQSRTLFEFNGQNQLVSETRDVALDIEDRFALPVSIAMIFTVPLLFFARRRPRWVVVILLSIPLQVLAWQSDESEVSVLYQYDSAGNLIAETYPGEEQINYRYDDFNRLLEVSRENAIGATLSQTRIHYNAIGQVSDIFEPDTEADSEIHYKFIYDNNGLLAVHNITSDHIQHYFSPVPGEIFLVTDSENTFWTIDDGLGQLSHFVDASGNIMGDDIAGFSRNAFQEIINKEALIPGTEFTGQFYLSDANIVLMGVRAYHPRLGRFLQHDPVRHDPRANLYSFAYNSPTNFDDPTGMTAEAAFRGLDPENSIVDPMEFIQHPWQNNLPDMPDVEQLQSDENHRILNLAYSTEFIINDSAFHLTDSACDVYLRVLNPLDEADQLQWAKNRRRMLDLYEGNDWLPLSNPQPGRSSIAMDELAIINNLLSRSLQNGQALEGCDNSFDLPSVQVSSATAFYDELIDLRLMLDEISMYSAVSEEIMTLPAVAIPEVVLPDIIDHSLSPTILPDFTGNIQDLRDDTAMLFGDILLPDIGSIPFEWQHLNQALDVAPVSAVRVKD